jgi:hypothetical protein
MASSSSVEPLLALCHAFSVFTTVYTGPVTLHFHRTEPVIALLLAALPLLLDTAPASLCFLGVEPARLKVLLAS